MPYRTVLQQHLNLIVKNCIEVEPNLHAIILYGGYSRNEGSWIIEQDGNYRPYNDYDILLILEKKIPVERIELLRKNLAKKIGIRWVDISQKTPEELKKLRPSIYNFDLKYASNVIRGDSSVLKLIPEIEVKKLPLKEGEVLFFTRLWTFLGSLDEKGMNVDREGEESRFFRNQMAKAILAIVDVLLLQRCAYHPSYRERVNRFIKLYPEKIDLLILCQWALEEKLFPTAPDMTTEEVENLYCKVHRYYFSEMYQLLSKYYGRKVNTPEDIESYVKWAPSSLVRRIAVLVARRNMIFERKITINLAQVYVASAYEDNNINNRLLKKGLELMRLVNKTLPEKMTWDDARVRISQIRVGL